jgi:ArsR family transcriptional regulator, lead/cadmium/zinc/bismuth-responsive transcriptional repressor
MRANPKIEVCDVPLVDPDRVERVQARMIDDLTAHRLAETFAAMADSTRLRIIEALSQEELCVCDLSAALRLSQSATSHQLRTLRNLRLVKYRRRGRLVYYSLDDAHISRLFAQGLEHVCEDSAAAATPQSAVAAQSV